MRTILLLLAFTHASSTRDTERLLETESLSRQEQTEEEFYRHLLQELEERGNQLQQRYENSGLTLSQAPVGRPTPVKVSASSSSSSQPLSSQNPKHQNQQTKGRNGPKTTNQHRAPVSKKSQLIPLEGEELDDAMKDVETMKRMKKSSDIENKIQEMQRRYRNGIDPNHPINVVIYNILLKSYTRESRFQDAKDLIIRMVAEPVYARPDQWTYNTLIKGYASKGKIDAALKLKDEMRFGDLGLDIRPDLGTYNTILDGIAKTNSGMSKILSAETLKTEMKGLGLVPNETTYHSLIMIYVICNKDDKIMATVREMRKKGIKFESQHWLSQQFTSKFNRLFPEDNPMREVHALKKQGKCSEFSTPEGSPDEQEISQEESVDL